MRVEACSNIPYRATPRSGITRPRISPKIRPTTTEPNYGKNLKQTAYVISVLALSLSSIILGTRGKLCGIKL